MLDSMPLNLGDLCTRYRFSDIDCDRAEQPIVPTDQIGQSGGDHRGPVIAIAVAAVVAAGVPLSPQAASAADSASTYQQVDARLATLAQTQSQSEAERILDGGGNVQALVDPDDGSVLAAFRSSTRALTPVGPRYATTSRT